MKILNEYEGVKIHAVPIYVKMPARLFNETYYDRAVNGLARYIKKTPELAGADWIYAHFLTDMGYVGARLKEKLNIKVAAIVRGDDVNAWPKSKPELAEHIRYCFAHCDLLLANNKGLARQAMTFAREIKPDFKIAYNGINYQDFEVNASLKDIAAIRAEHGLPENKKIMLCIAGAEYMKGWGELLQAVAANRQAMGDWLLLAITNKVGRGEYYIDVEGKAKELGLQDIVVVKNKMPFEVVKRLYPAVDVFVLPSYSEGISNAVMEAMASGCWTITTDVGGHSEIIENNVNGFLIAPKSQKDLDDILSYTLAHYDERREEIGKAARASMERLGDYNYNARLLLDMFVSHDKAHK